MTRSDRQIPAGASRWQPLVALCLLAVVGCGGAISEEQKAVFAKFQAMGGRINFRSGGYEIDLARTQVSDDDLADLHKIAKVTSVDLRNTKVSDAGLEHLKTLDALEFVALPRAGAVTAEGADSLRQALPDTLIQQL